MIIQHGDTRLRIIQKKKIQYLRECSDIITKRYLGIIFSKSFLMRKIRAKILILFFSKKISGATEFF